MKGPSLRRIVRPLVSPPRTQVQRQNLALRRSFTGSTNKIEVDENTSEGIAFCFDIDGVLLRSSTPIPGATEALRTLQSRRIPFILMTNGGGKHESERIADLSQKLSVPLDVSMLVQSHTPFRELEEHVGYKDKCVLVVGGDGAKCREVAEAYGFTNVVTPGDIYAAHPEIWPFSKHFMDYYHSFARPLPKPVDPASPENSLKIDAIFIYNDPRDWGLDIQLIIDLLLSREGIMGTISSKNGDQSLPNSGYLQDNQPMLFYSNPDLIWASKYALPRLGQGAFRQALTQVWRAVSSQDSAKLSPDIEFRKTANLGKPSSSAYKFAERKLIQHRGNLLGLEVGPLRKIFMVGDNPASDIQGANSYRSRYDIDWISVLTRTGVFTGTLPSRKLFHPQHIVEDVAEAVALGLDHQQPARTKMKPANHKRQRDVASGQSE